MKNIFKSSLSAEELLFQIEKLLMKSIRFQYPEELAFKNRLSDFYSEIAKF